MVGDGVGLRAEVVCGTEGLRPDEAHSVSRAVPKRVAEYAAGRRAARSALAEIGYHDITLPMGEDRAPIWPEGVAGSITHDAGIALAAVATADCAQSIGIDLTEARPLPEGVRDQILRHPKEAVLDELEARSVFAAKECLFKALSPAVGFVFGFSAVIVKPDLEAGMFEAELLHALGPYPAGERWRGRIALRDRKLVAALVLPPKLAPRPH